MLKSDVIRFFEGNGAEVARKLNIGRAAVSRWGQLVPPLFASQLHLITGGKLHYDPADYHDFPAAAPIVRRTAAARTARR